MKLGLLTAAFPHATLEEVADWAGGAGFEALEIAAWPPASGESRRYSGVCHLTVNDMSPTHGDDLVGSLAVRGLTISALGYYPNPLDPHPEVRERTGRHLRELFQAASTLGVSVVNTFVGADHRLSSADNLDLFRSVWPELVRAAADAGVKVAIENCPMLFSSDEWPSGKNLAYSPSLWRMIFEETPGDTLGLNLDPSHLLWQMIDVERVVREFGPRIYHAHAKDLQIDRDALYEHGVLSLGVGWQVPRLPGLGEVRWDRFIAALYRSGYDHALCVEHEDRDFEGSDARIKRGFEIARDTLRHLVR
jgi:sugar phosphate isomerase/epimerase